MKIFFSDIEFTFSILFYGERLRKEKGQVRRTPYFGSNGKSAMHLLYYFYEKFKGSSRYLKYEIRASG